MKKIMPLVAAITVYARLNELGHPMAGLICGVVFGALCQYAFKSLNGTRSKQPKVYPPIKIVRRNRIC